ncbi:hypothetical protein FFK22_041615 [Mycobacterium sp. KBS0706]|uniref:hypothetical protein n=1 Tax=Mycobacterium sp. KBS0706 TaxID=2578109 RepID=UPI00110FF734|nr:hypothetical protein [Mycobacterium sp. KBS0706]TSD82726.1 hypothetical protein FFK22_041615 [Mycobacterium sp. KBS0706]
MPPRDPVLRHADYEDDFDFTTVFCDAFWDAKRQAIHLVGPPLLNLEAELDLQFRAAPSMQACAFEVRHKWWTDVVTVTVPVGTTGLIIETTVGHTYMAPQPNLSDLFAGRRCILTVNQGNDIPSIRDWVRYYAHGHGCNGVVLYDCNSDTSGLREIDNELRSIDPAIEVLVVGWPFRPGVLDGHRPLSHGIWDSLYGQAALFEQARLRNLAKARSVVSTDIDGLAVTRDGQSLFEIVEQSKTGFLRFGGWHAYMIDATPTQPRHRQNYYKRRGDLASCMQKWAVVPGRASDSVQWASHNIIGMVQDETSFKVRLRQLTTEDGSWDVDSSSAIVQSPEQIDDTHDNFEPDEELRLTLARIFGRQEDRRETEAPARA